ncbi:MAG: acyl-CoA synthetase FdrA [Chloroflexota bacterium]|nr:MAG: acyl-CoA synthetase FdrA [Chloroflexota bacterium]
MVIKARVKRNTYFDSITLMKIARALTSMNGIEDAAAIMATAANLHLLEEAGLTPFEGNAGAEDVLLVVRASDESSADTALESAEEQLTQRPGVSSVDGDMSGHKQPRSLEQAIQLQPESSLAVISVPGPYAALESDRALRAGLHVFLFSDNVSLEDEIALKHLAQERGLLFMGPDCGTAMLNGVGLGFVNVVPAGPIGIVGASGTGIQQVMSVIARLGGGVSQVIGCGGRDLSEKVGAITTLQGLRLLQEDEQTEVIVLVSKPPAPAVAERVLRVAVKGKKPVIVIFVGADHSALEKRYGHRVVVARTLAEAARKAVSVGGGSDTMTGTWRVHEMKPVSPVKTHGAGGQFLSALFSGGTLCDEAMHLWAKPLGAIYSNIPLKPEWRLVEEGKRVEGHCAIDFGADEYTRGRPHPMIDPGLRLKRLQEEASNPRVGVILLDIVLGYCSHPDPAAVYGPAILAARKQADHEGRSLTFVISLCGTEGDPQRLSVQTRQLREAGAEIFTSNADAALRCIEILR